MAIRTLIAFNKFSFYFHFIINRYEDVNFKPFVTKLLNPTNMNWELNFFFKTRNGYFVWGILLV